MFPICWVGGPLFGLLYGHPNLKGVWVIVMRINVQQLKFVFILEPFTDLFHLWVFQPLNPSVIMKTIKMTGLFLILNP